MGQTQGLGKEEGPSAHRIMPPTLLALCWNQLFTCGRSPLEQELLGRLSPIRPGILEAGTVSDQESSTQ